MPRPLAALPKAHLHLHLEAAMRPATLADLAEHHGLPVPEVRGFGSFTAFSAMYGAATAVLRDRADWERLADEVCADAVADGAAYLEPSFWPGNYAERFGSDEACWELVFDVFDAASARHGVCVRFMHAGDRVRDTPDEVTARARLAAKQLDRVVSFGLANDEVGHPPGDFVEGFRIAREAGLLSTPHAGELEGPGFVLDALDLLGADRIQHGVRSPEMPGLVERLAERGTCLDVCPTSNILLGIFPSLAEHPLPALLAAGVRCSVNADDPLLFGPGLLEEYELCRSAFGFDDATLAGIARTSIEASGAPDDVKATALAGIAEWLALPPGS